MRPARRFGAGALLASLVSGPVFAQETPLPTDTERPGEAGPQGASPAHRWHLPTRNSRKLPRHLLYRTEDDWNPLAGTMHSLKDEAKSVGFQYDLDLAFLGQSASDVDTGHDEFATYLWQTMGDWELLSRGEPDAGYVCWNAFGGGGLNYNADSETLSSNVGSVQTLNQVDVLDDPIILDELFWKQKLVGGDLIVSAGKMDLSYHFDTNAVANNPYRQFNAFGLINNLSIPFPAYGGFGAVVKFKFDERFYLMGGAGDSSADPAVAPWKTSDNNSWYQLAEFGATLHVDGLGSGTYRVIPWRSELFSEKGWGLGLSMDQELAIDGLVGFFRFGLGDDDVTPVETFLSGGLTLHDPFGCKGDSVAVGVSWADPSPGAGVREETLFETFYELQLSPSVYVTPHLQVVLDPAASVDGDTSVVGGIRVTVEF